MSRSFFCPSSPSAIQLSARAWHSTVLPSAWVSSATVWLSSRCWNRRITPSAGRTLTCPCPAVKSSYHDYFAYLLCLFFFTSTHVAVKLFSFFSASRLTTSLLLFRKATYYWLAKFSSHSIKIFYWFRWDQNIHQNGENCSMRLPTRLYLLACLRSLPYGIGKFSHWLTFSYSTAWVALYSFLSRPRSLLALGC